MMSYNFLMVLLFLYVNWSIGVKVACRTSNDASFETVCECTERTRTVNCSYRGLNEWPVGIPINTYYLGINNNSLRRLPSFPKSIQSVYAAYNLLTDISTAFNDLPRLYNVYIQHNSITSLDNTLFKDSPSINKLDISFNQIHTIEPFTFAKLQLSVIDIQYNHNLQRLCENSFALTTRLNYGIVIANNNLVHISTGTFKNVTGGSGIFLNGNTLQNIPSRAFQGGNTQIINLEENKISFIHKDAFFALDSIHIL
ncbi:tsukushi-A-like [Antedon mediterranea]|uniref:tsukushi-A-like n=1 Tax=Antedon mediterranea TaxID=105859 RepID=UPI003AF7F672